MELPSPLDPSAWLLLCRTVRFGDTDGAGVMHFHQLLRWCHEAYEESLERFGIPADQVFPRPVWDGEEEASGDSTAVDVPGGVAAAVALLVGHVSSLALAGRDARPSPLMPPACMS